MDGFEAVLKVNNQKYILSKADVFENYPFGNKLIYNSLSKDFAIERLQIVPDGKNAVYIEYLIKNFSNKTLNIELEIIGISNLMPVWLGERTQMLFLKVFLSVMKKFKPLNPMSLFLKLNTT